METRAAPTTAADAAQGLPADAPRRRGSRLLGSPPPQGPCASPPAGRTCPARAEPPGQTAESRAGLPVDAGGPGRARRGPSSRHSRRRRARRWRHGPDGPETTPTQTAPAHRPRTGTALSQGCPPSPRPSSGSRGCGSYRARRERDTFAGTHSLRIRKAPGRTFLSLFCVTEMGFPSLPDGASVTSLRCSLPDSLPARTGGPLWPATDPCRHQQY